MGRVISNMSMSLDGFIADPNDGVEEIFRWYGAGPVEVRTANEGISGHLSTASADVFRSALASTGALVCGRRLYDLTGGWGGRHPIGGPVFVVTHQPPDDPPAGPDDDPPITFVTEGVARAVELARAAAGDLDVGIASPDIIRQCLDLGLLDVIAVDLVPVLLGKGIRYFDQLSALPVRLSDPIITEAPGVTHLRYDVIRETVRA